MTTGCVDEVPRVRFPVPTPAETTELACRRSLLGKLVDAAEVLRVWGARNQHTHQLILDRHPPPGHRVD